MSFFAKYVSTEPCYNCGIPFNNIKKDDPCRHCKAPASMQRYHEMRCKHNSLIKARTDLLKRVCDIDDKIRTLAKMFMDR